MKQLINKQRVGEGGKGGTGETSGDVNIFSRSPALPLPRSVVLGVDPGLATTGWGVLSHGGAEPTLIAFGAILSPARTALPHRLRQIRSELAALIVTHQPVVLAIEQLFFTKFATSIAATAQARGIILLVAAEAEIPVVEYNPRSVKIALTGFGSASKLQMQSMVQSRFRLKELPRPDDAADALAIALCHVQTWREPTTERQRPTIVDRTSQRNVL